MSSIDVLGVHPVKLAHTSRKIAFRCFQDLTPELLKHNAAICGCFVASADKQSDSSALLLQLASIVAHGYN
jgi:hypothetical protein